MGATHDPPIAIEILSTVLLTSFCEHGGSNMFARLSVIRDTTFNIQAQVQGFVKFNRKKRAISYIMEVVMMTLVVTALASVVLTWGISTITASRASLGGAVQARMDRVQEGLVVQDVQLISSTQLRVWVRNSGSIQIVVDQIYVNNNQGTITNVCVPNKSPPCSSVTPPGKLSLPIQAVGAVDITVPSNTVVATTGTATSGTTTALTDTTKSWTATQWVNCAVTITSGLGVGQTRTITLSTATTLTVSTWTAPDSTSQYSILGICSGATYTVIAATTRGTTFQGSFTV